MALFTNATHHGGLDKPRVRIRGVEGQPLILYQFLVRNDAYRQTTILGSLDELSVYILYERMESGHTVTPQELRELLEEAGIVHGIDESSLAMLSDLVNKDSSWAKAYFQVASGTPPKHGEDGHLEFYVLPSSRKPRYEMDESGNIDYHELNLIKSAVKGQCVAVLRQPGKGVSGMNVLGKKILARDGDAISARAGNGIYSSDDNTQFFALEDGRPVYENGMLSITKDYRVVGDVDFKVGNIDFIGEISITGSVLDEFKVIGHRDVTINGNIGCARVEAEGKLVIGGGVSGKETGFVRSGSSLRARYLNEVTARSEGDLIVMKEILNCTVQTHGFIQIPQGTILGGKVYALKGIEAEVIGSPLGTATEILAGIDWDAHTRMQEKKEQIGKIEREIIDVSERLRPLLEEKKVIATVAPEKRETLISVLNELRQLKTYLSKLEAEYEQTKGDGITDPEVRINVLKRLYTGTRIKFPGLEALFKEQIRGPVSIIPDIKRKAIRIVEYRPFKQTTEI